MDGAFWGRLSLSSGEQLADNVHVEVQLVEPRGFQHEWVGLTGAVLPSHRRST